MPALGRGPRAGGGAQSPEPPSEVRSPRPGLVERAGGRTSRRGGYGKGGRLERILSGWGARARSRLVRCQRTPGEVALGRAERDSPSSAGRGARLRAAAARVLRLPPKPPAPGGRPLPRTGRSWRWPPPAALRGWREACHYLLFTSVNRFEALRVGGQGAAGTEAGEGGGEGGAAAPAREPELRLGPALGAQLRPAPRRRVLGPRRAPGGKGFGL